MKCSAYLFLLASVMLTSVHTRAQVREPVNGAEDERSWTVALVNAHIMTGDAEIVSGQMLVEGNRIKAVGKTVNIPRNAQVIDLKGKRIYPSFIELCSEYGLEKPGPGTSPDDQPRHRGKPHPDRSTEGARYWNEAVHPENGAIYSLDPGDDYRKLLGTGFGIVLTGLHDGVIHGTSALIMLGDESLDDLVIRSHAALSASFTKGSSKQDYPNSQMGSIALLRQAVLDAKWYAAHQAGNNISLQVLAAHLGTPWVGYTAEWQEVLRMDRVMASLDITGIVRGNGDEFKNLKALAGMKGLLVVPFYQPQEKAKHVPLSELPLSELQSIILRPQNMARLSQVMAEFGITASGLKKPEDFTSKIREAVKYGLDPDKALKALTVIPARKLGVQDIGSLKAGNRANFFICDSNYFTQDAVVSAHWINGKKYVLVPEQHPASGTYRLMVEQDSLLLHVKYDHNEITGKIEPDSKAANVVINGNAVYIRYKDVTLNGTFLDDGQLKGTGFRDGTEFQWTGRPKQQAKKSSEKEKMFPDIEFRNPFAYAERENNDYFIRNVTVWTSSGQGIIQDCNVLVKDGKIAGVGQNIVAPAGIPVIDGSGKHLTPGIIDEHSHIAISKGVNEGTQAVTSEVRIGDVVNARDINLYRQLAGGVTTSHLLHGSANPVGGQTALIKLRYGLPPEDLKFGNDHRFIKFALGENVKQSNWGDQQTVRFPQTRMGVEQVFIDAFTRALDYEVCRKTDACPVNLELEALLEILHGKRFITCHSYRQDEINMLMHVADSFGFTVNTFTHILEGYKVADKMFAHGAGGSTFADWWGYKFEVNDAIPWNAAIMHEMGIVTAINSDDPEMGRRLNQEAAKTVKYGGVSEEDALKMITINPAILLHIDNVTGSIETGKHADLVLWDGHPLSNYSRVETTWVDGVIYFNRQLNDSALQTIEALRMELIGIISSMGVKESEKPDAEHEIYHCDDMTGYLLHGR